MAEHFAFKKALRNTAQVDLYKRLFLKMLRVQRKKDDNSQLWKFVRLSDNSYKIISLVDDRALDVDDFGAGGGGTNVQVYNNWDCTAQRFYIYDIYGSYYIKPVCTDMVLDMSQTTNNLEVWGRGEDWAPQKFDIQKTTNIIHTAVC